MSDDEAYEQLTQDMQAMCRDLYIGHRNRTLH